MNAITFPIAGTPRILCPGSHLVAAGRAILATGHIKRVIANRDAVAAMTIGVYDAHDANGDTFRSTGRFKREIDLTAAAALRQAVFECYGTGIGGGPALAAYNLRAEWGLLPETSADGQVEIDCDITCWHGMIVQVVGPSGGSVSVVYEPIAYGKYYLNRAQHQLAY